MAGRKIIYNIINEADFKNNPALAIKPSSLPIEPQNQRSRHTKTKLGRSSSRNHQPTTTATQDLPLVMGKRFLKVENIDLEELLVNFFFFSIFTAILIYLN